MVTEDYGNSFDESLLHEAAIRRVVGRDRHVEFTLDDHLSLDTVDRGLRSYLQRTGERFRGGSVSLNLGSRRITQKDLNQLVTMLVKEYGLRVVGLWCGQELLEELLADRGTLPVDLVVRPAISSTQDVVSPDTLLWRGTCRSGTTVHNSGNLVVLGDVNPGAEVTATGDILIFGKLRGLAHAGVGGSSDTGAVVIGISLEAAQLRLGSQIHISSPRTLSKGNEQSPFMARLENGTMRIDQYTPRSVWPQWR